ncbi:hypothetical protein K431DRAFT_274106 [Polychaeton citri CBS 116435]|uniref:C3H1-type domain-containing protein n=1 Tax=Polychaeton citri CBS 116435 TaxID=1314669 RepID=A0A9P4Q3C7_9PEZI|nr:hypothetical protein K431DRAFT_274106 [Polychaeton citri CBS 116435]
MDGQNQAYGGSDLYGDNPQFNNSFDQYFNPAGSGPPQFNDHSWPVNPAPVDYPHITASRAQQAWHQPQVAANRLAAPASNQGTPNAFARSPAHSPASFTQNNFTAYPASTQNYGVYQDPSYNPSFAPAAVQNARFPSGYQSSSATPANQTSTVAPQALNFERPSPQSNDANAHNNPNVQKMPYAAAPTVDQRALAAAIPSGGQSGIFTLISYDALARSTSSQRLGNFVNIGNEAHEWLINRASLPPFVPRKSKNELRKLAGDNPALLEKLGKKAKKDSRLPTDAAKPAEKQVSGDYSSSEDSSSDDDDSEYTSSEEENAEPSPLPPKRPENARDAVEYDTIKALWRSKRQSIDRNSVSKGIVDFWDVVKTIRDRWKSDKEVADAASAKSNKTDAVLAGRVKDQRDMIEAAFKTAVKHGHRGVVEYLGENKSLIFLCYQFLIDRFKAEEMNGALARSILETMSLFTTLTEETLEKTHLVKVLPRYEKKGDAKSKFYAKKIQQNASAATKEQMKKTSATTKPSDSAPTNDVNPSVNKGAGTGQIAGAKRAASGAHVGGATKKMATGDTARPGSTQPGSNRTTVSGLKKAALSRDAAKPVAPSSTSLAAKPKTVTAKPASSGFFSGLQSASRKSAALSAGKPNVGTVSKLGEAKSINPTASASASKPTFSFAETMANLTKPKEEKPVQKPEMEKAKETPPETPEQKAKRLRKESRRHLHVSFRPAEELEQIRYFTHDPEEDLGHDSSQVRDVSDVGGEGRMFKQQHQQMDVDEDEDGGEEEEKLRDFREPSAVDFSIVDQDERKRNYAKFGGGEQQPDATERSARESYESNNLLAVYASASDIPSNPREPPEIEMTGQSNVQSFGEPPAKYEARAKNRKGQPMSQVPQQVGGGLQPGQNSFSTGPSLLSSILQNLPSQQSQQNPPPPQPQAPAAPDLKNILAALQRSAALPTSQSSAAAPPPPAVPSAFAQPPQPSVAPGTQQPNLAQLDIASIMQQLQQTSQQQISGSTPFQGGGSMPFQYQQSSNKHPFYKTKACKYWRDGKCTRGASCSYLHEDS